MPVDNDPLVTLVRKYPRAVLWLLVVSTANLVLSVLQAVHVL